MKRKLLLMVCSFIILLLAFGTYQLFVPGISILDPRAGTRMRPALLTFDPSKGPGIGKTKGITFYYRNPEGQLRGVYKAQSWTKEDDGSFVLEKPQAVVYQRDGTRVYLQAERGQFWAEEVAGGSGFNIRHGQADGKVEIFYDQTTDDTYGGEERPHPKDRPYEQMIQNVLRIVTHDIQFSQDMLELRTDSEVTIWSRQIDMNGKGLLLQWNEDPRELRLLRLEKGNILVVKDMPEQVDLVQLPTKEKPPTTQPTTAATTKPAPAVATSAPANDVNDWGLAKPSTNTSTSAPAQRLGRREKPETNVITKLGSPPPAIAKKNATKPAPPKKREMRNIYEAKFHKDVRIFSGQRSLKGAVELGMVFEWDRAWKPEKGKKKHTPASATTGPTARPASQPTTQPKWASRAAAAGVRDMKLNENEAKDSTRQMVIYWDDALEILPKGRTETPDRKRFTISGQGPQVRLTDKDARILCTKFQFQNPQQEAWFDGTKERPARVQLVRGDEITCHGRIRFVRSLGKAYLEGPGEMVRYARDEEMTNWNLVPVQQAPWRLLLDRVTWADRVEASFDERKIVTRSGNRETRPYIKDAAFYENVKMVQFVQPIPRGEDGEKQSSVEATDRLQVWMGLTDEGKNYPSKVEAVGKVTAFQQGSNIEAGQVAIEFQPKVQTDEDKKPAEPVKVVAAPEKPKPTTRSLTTASPADAKVAKIDKKTATPDRPKREKDDPLAALGGSVEPTSIKASGDVRVTYSRPDKPDEPPLRIEADMADVDVTRGLAVLTGAPAKIWQGDNHIEGEVINFDRNAEAAKVTGEGQLRFYTNQDLSGNRVDKPRPVQVKWKNWMLYHGQAGQCIFDGSVNLASAEEKMVCPKQMRLFFQPRKEASKTRKAQGIQRGARSLSMGIDDFSGADFSRIEADGGKDEKQWVNMRTQRMHPKNATWVLQRMQIRGKQILYDEVKGFAYVNGPGDFLAEDYRAPEKKGRSDQRKYANMMGGAVSRPSQTLFRWKTAMALNMNSRHVRLRNGVNMIHRSGNQMLKLPGLKTQKFTTLKNGRLSTLRAGVVDAWFGEPKSKIAMRDEHGRIKKPQRPRRQDLLQGGPEFGELRKFNAEKDVSMQMADDGFRYGMTTIDGNRIFYDALREIIEVTGFPEGATKRTDAQITIEDRRAGVPPKTVRAPVLIYDLKNDVIRVDTLRGGGGR